MSKVSEFKQIIVIFVIALIMAGCGSKQSPTGGKEDIDKLKVMASLPAEFFEIDEQKVEITFNKSVDKSAFMKGIYIYPPVANRKLDFDGNVVTVKFLEALKADTNYYLTLTTRIRDIRGNALDKNQTLIFRHGQLQSSRISGAIIYEERADNGLPVQINLLTADSLWVLASSFTGNSYALESLNQLDYLLRAYIDKNLNGRYDAGFEPYTETSLKSQQIVSFDLNMAYADTVKPVIRMVNAVSNREYEIVMNKSLKSFRNVRVEDLRRNETLRIFTLNHDMDRIKLLTSETDSTGYRFTIEDATDNKGNVTVTNSVTIPGSNKDDKTAPAVVSTIPRNGASVDNLQPTIEITFSEIIPSSLFKATLLESDSRKTIPFRVIRSNHTTYQLQPEQPLANFKSCLLTIENDTSDLSGNKLAEPYKLTFLPILREPGK